MVAPIPTQLLTTVNEFDDFLTQPENRRRLFELIQGEIVEKMPTEEHGFIAGQVVRYLGNFVEDNDIDGIAGVEVRHQQPGDKFNDRLPDVSYRATTSPIVTQGAVARMPDIAVEIQSSDDSPREMREAAQYYLRNGTKLVWLFFPKNRVVEKWTFKDGEFEVILLSEDDTLDGDDVLPGFSVLIKKVLPKK
jgi:Uma2 family endonuclease